VSRILQNEATFEKIDALFEKIDALFEKNVALFEKSMARIVFYGNKKNPSGQCFI